MKGILLLVTLFISCVLHAQETKDVIIRNGAKGYSERYRALASDTTIKHGSYRKVDFFSGAPKLMGSYKFGKKDGRWQEFSVWDMFMVGLGNYTDDVRTGEWTFFSRLNVKEQVYDYTKKKLIFNAPDTVKKYTVVNGKDTLKNVLLDSPPLFIGGNVSLMTFVLSNIEIPEVKSTMPIQGDVTMACLVDKTGHAIKIWVKKGLEKHVDKAALDVSKKIPDTWIPGTLKGKPTNSVYLFRIPFKV